MENNKIQKSPQVVATLFVDRTHNSVIVDRLRREEELLGKITGYKVKLIEKIGVKLEHMLVKRDPFEGWSCNWEDCICCKYKPQFNGNLNCNKQNVLYRAEWPACESCWWGKGWGQ